MTGKQRAALRKASMGLDTVFQVGKAGIEPSVVKATADCLAARELIKMRVLENSALTARAAADEMAQRTGSEVVLVRGHTFVLFLQKKKESAFAAMMKP